MKRRGNRGGGGRGGGGLRELHGRCWDIEIHCSGDLRAVTYIHEYVHRHGYAQ